MYKKILVALENGRADESLVPHIAELARRLGSELLLVHVADGFAARNFEQLKLAESDEMRADRSYLVDKLSPRPRRLIEIGTVILSIVLFAAIAGWGAQLTWDEYRFEVSSPGLGLPQWIYTGWVPVLAAASVLRLLGRLKRVRDARA